MAAAPDRASLLTPAFVALTAAELLYFLTQGVLLAATPLFSRDVLDADDRTVGLVIGAFSVTTLVLRPFAGRWSDRHGRRLLLVAGAALCAAAVLAHLAVDSVAGLVALRLVLGAAEAAFFVASFATLADLAPPGRAGEALSLNSLALYVGIALGPLLAQGALRLDGFRGAWLTATALAVGAVVLAARVPETHGDTDPGDGRLLHPAALGPGAVLLVGVGVTAGFLGFGVLQARAIGLTPWALAPLLFGATVVLVRIVLRTLPDRTDPMRLAGAALLVDAAGMGLVALAEAPVLLALAAVLLGTGTALVTPAVFAAVFGRVSPGERGSAAATTSLFIDLGLSGGPVAIGTLAASTGVAGSFGWWALLPLVAGAAVASATGRRNRRGR